MSAELDIDSLDLDDIAVMGARLPDGTYDVKLTDIQAGSTKAGVPCLKPTFEVTSGPEKGLTHQGMYYLGTYKTKAGKIGSMGVMQIKRDAMELGVLGKLPNPFPLDANKAKLAFHKAFKGAKMRLHIQDGEPSKKDGKVYKEFRLLPGTTVPHDEEESAEGLIY